MPERATGRGATGAAAVLAGEAVAVWPPGLAAAARRLGQAREAAIEVEARIDRAGGTPRPAVRRGVAVIDVAGPLSKTETIYNWWFGTLTYPQLVEQINAALADRRVKAVLLRADTPGGTVAGVSDLADAIAAARRSKPVVAYVSDMAASAGYYAASQADRIVGDADALVGSIGTILIVDDFSKAFEQMGIETKVYSSGGDPYHAEGTVGTEITAEQGKDFQRVVDELGEIFIQAVHRGRPSLKGSTLKLPDGRVYVGQKAVELGLMDAVAGFDEVLAAMQEGDLTATRAGRGAESTAAGRWQWNEAEHRYQARQGRRGRSK